MKTFFKKFFIVVSVLLSTTITTNLVSKQSAYAAGDGCRPVLGLQSWDCGIGDVTDSSKWSGDDNIINNIWIVVANVSNDLLVIAAYLILGFVIYGGYLYMTASGDPGKTASGKKTLSRAFIGLAIIILAKVIVSSIHIALLGSAGYFSENCTDPTQCTGGTPDQLVINLVQWTIGIAGLVAAVFIVIGAIGYLTAAGDPNKLKKAKDTILYALIGLAIVGLAEIIASFVSGAIRDANSYINTTTIAKELK